MFPALSSDGMAKKNQCARRLQSTRPEEHARSPALWNATKEPDALRNADPWSLSKRTSQTRASRRVPARSISIVAGMVGPPEMRDGVGKLRFFLIPPQVARLHWTPTP